MKRLVILAALAAALAITAKLTAFNQQKHTRP